MEIKISNHELLGGNVDKVTADTLMRFKINNIKKEVYHKGIMEINTSLSVSVYSIAAAIRYNWINEKFNNGGLHTKSIRLNVGGDDRDELTVFFKSREVAAEKYLEDDDSGVIIYKDNKGMASYNIYEESSDVMIAGDEEFVKKVADELEENFGKSRVNAKWYYNKNEYVTIPVNTNNIPTTDSYPFLRGEKLEDYFDRFMSSDANVLLLYGKPGLGKSSFIKALLNHTKGTPVVSYNYELLYDDSLFAQFMEDSKSRFFILEDADTLLKDRAKNDNHVMQKFLNLGDGILSNKKKKIIITTNLENLNSIDPALTRPGRCFDALEFTPLTKEQALNLNPLLQLEQEEYTLAEIYNDKKTEVTGESKKVGFR